jgi:phospholipid N-methyltransferase
MDTRHAQTVIPQEILAILSNVQIESNGVKIQGRLDRKLYQSVNVVLENLGGKWNRQTQSHIFTDDPTKTLEHVLLTGRYTRLDKCGFFPTPPALVSRLLELAEIEAGHYVLEPSAGGGNIADAIRREHPFCNLSVIEFQPKLRETLSAKGHHLISEPDFMNYANGIRFDRIVMNPPFEHQQDIDHVLHAYDLLKSGGQLIAIMSAGTTFRTNRKTLEFRAFLGKHEHAPGLNGYIEHNPEGSFKEAGTDVATITISLVKE